MKKTTYTISIYTENNVGLLNRISAIFLKRHINIRSVTSSESEIPNIYRFIIVVKVDVEQIIKLVKQIEKQIEDELQKAKSQCDEIMNISGNNIKEQMDKRNGRRIV